MKETQSNDNRFKQLLWNFFSSGLAADTDLDILRKHFLINLLVVVGSVFLVFFICFAIIQNDLVLALADVAFLGFAVSLLFFLRIRKNPDYISLLASLVSGVFVIFLFSYGSMAKATYLWALTYPLVTLYFLGKKYGSFLAITFLVLISFIYFLANNTDVIQPFDSILFIRFFAVYLILYLFAFAAEFTQHITKNKLTQSKKELLAAFTEIQTSSDELTVTNKQLCLEIDERKRIEKALKNSEEFLDDVIESIQDGISVLDADLTIRHANNKMQQWYEQNLPLVGKKCYDCFHNKTGPCDPCPTIRCMQSGKTEMDIVAGLPDSPVEWVELFSFPIKDKETGEVTGAVEFVRDITAAKRLERQLAYAQKMQAIGTLAGGIAHDFNNLMMGIQGHISLMSTDLSPEDPNNEHIQAIEAQVSSATNLTKQLLATARGGKYDPKPVDLNALILSSSEMFGRTRKEIKIITHLCSPALVAEVDRQQFEQVLLNMYLNAWQAMPEGGVLQIQTCRQVHDIAVPGQYSIPAGDYAKISITDSGTGMDEETQQQIFDPFFTTKAKERGTGLGLASVYGIIKNHDGHITVYSEVGQGTTLDIYLPLSLKTPAYEAPKELEILHGEETILLVDDEDVILDVGRALLSKLGYTVIVAKGGLQAIEILHTDVSSIDLVILDLIMPEMHGRATFDKIKEIAPTMPVILSSGYAVNDQASEIMAKGCEGFIQKPFSISEISQKIRAVLDA